MRKRLKQHQCRQHEQKRPTKHHNQQCVAETYNTVTCNVLIIKHVQKPKGSFSWASKMILVLVYTCGGTSTLLRCYDAHLHKHPGSSPESQNCFSLAGLFVHSQTVKRWNALTAGIWAHPSALQCNSSFFDAKWDCGLCKCLLGFTYFHKTITAPSYAINHVATWATMHGFSSESSLLWSTSLISNLWIFTSFAGSGGENKVCM